MPRFPDTYPIGDAQVALDERLGLFSTQLKQHTAHFRRRTWTARAQCRSAHRFPGLFSFVKLIRVSLIQDH